MPDDFQMKLPCLPNEKLTTFKISMLGTKVERAVPMNDFRQAVPGYLQIDNQRFCATAHRQERDGKTAKLEPGGQPDVVYHRTAEAIRSRMALPGAPWTA